MTTIDKEHKVPILLAALEERYKSLHVIRERVQSIGVWALGLMIGAGGWLLQNQVQMGFLQKCICIIGVAIAFIVLRFNYIANLNKGFKAQQQTAVRLE